MKYEMKRPCSTCPFVEGTENFGSAEWLIDVMKGLMVGSLTHTCHRTDPKADGFVRGEEPQACVGFLGMLKRTFNESSSPGLRHLSGKAATYPMLQGVDWAEIPTEGMFEARACVLHHAKAIGIEIPALAGTLCAQTKGES